METIPSQTTLRELPVGTRLLIRTRKDWRSAVVARRGERDVSLRVCCSSGRTYWTKRDSEMFVLKKKKISSGWKRSRKMTGVRICEI